MSANTMISIRPASNADSQTITDLIFNIWIHEYGFDVRKSDYPDLQDIETYYDGLFLVAEINGKVLGTIACDPLSDNQFVLKRMFVDAAQRGKGIAQKLLDALFKKVEGGGNHGATFYLSTKRDEAVAAEKFYLKNGFVEVAKDQLPSNFPFFYEDDLFMMRQR